MAHTAKFHLRPLPGDVVLLKMAQLVSKAFGDSKVNIQVLSNLPPDLNITGVAPKELAEEERIVQTIDNFKSRPYVTCHKIHIVQPEQPQLSLTYESKHDAGAVADLTVTYRNAAEGLQLADLAAQHFKLTSREVLVMDAIPEPFREAIRTRELSVQVFEEQVARLAILGTAQQERIDEFVRDRVAKLDERYETKESQLEEGFRAKEGTLEKREQAFARKEAEFDTHESKYMRRDLLKRIQERIENQKEIKLSAATAEKRSSIHWLFLFGIAASVTLVVFFARKLLATEQPVWYHWGPMATGMLFFATTPSTTLSGITLGSRSMPELNSATCALPRTYCGQAGSPNSCSSGSETRARTFRTTSLLRSRVTFSKTNDSPTRSILPKLWQRSLAT